MATATEVDFVITPTWTRAGKAIFTVFNDNTGNRYTYRVVKKESDDRPPVWFLALLTGPENTSNYTYLGLLLEDGTVKLTAKSPYGPGSRPLEVVCWALRRIWKGDWHRIKDGEGIIHAGRCGRCGRTLTVPASVYQGIGPECIKHMEG